MKKNHLVLAAAASAAIMVAPLALGTLNVITPAQITHAGTQLPTGWTQAQFDLLQSAVDAANSQKVAQIDLLDAKGNSYGQYTIDRAQSYLNGKPYDTKPKSPEYIASKLLNMISNSLEEGQKPTVETQKFLVNYFPEIKGKAAYDLADRGQKENAPRLDAAYDEASKAYVQTLTDQAAATNLTPDQQTAIQSQLKVAQAAVNDSSTNLKADAAMQPAIDRLKEAIKVATPVGLADADIKSGSGQLQLDRANAMTGNDLATAKGEGWDYTDSQYTGYYTKSGVFTPYKATTVDWQTGWVIGDMITAIQAGKPMTSDAQKYLANNLQIALDSLIVINDAYDKKEGPANVAAQLPAVQKLVVAAAQKTVDDLKKDSTSTPQAIQAAEAQLAAVKKVVTDYVSPIGTPNNYGKTTGTTSTTTPAGTTGSTYTPAPATTTAATPATTKPATVTPVQKANGVTIKAVAKTTKVTPVVDDNFKATSHKLAKNSSWKVSGVTIAPNGDVFYKVGANQFIRADAANLTMNAGQSLSGNGSIKVKKIATIKYVPGYGIQVWKNDFKTVVKNADGSKKKLNDKTSWKVSGIVKHDGHVFYNLGGNQYIDASYATLK
ncbi:SLAP domain-containing protein [Lacticaseibacillus pabuli]|uniref:SLAP domain-containing protein n=1 Tax=Lacticaseibacillus pabuli TaxID=3025672 RepID=A0ABY7WV38_9LACO|nr:SLAP domain-containing protein [Lacticaseibacillus sp. KACC 23028]WDF82866.1 SLAP domain-containing protein [Lacticaseibacillus sp. KACC 23028]